jgi:glycosyltransferase involved in cell wall biosynthesis
MHFLRKGMPYPKLTIITVSLNASTTIDATIQSVLKQTFRDYEYLIVDGKSTDGTLEILDRYQSQNFLKFISERDDGIYYAMNKAINLAQGEWIYFIGSDDVFYDDDTLKNVFLAIKNTDVEIMYGNVEFLNSGIIYAGLFDHEKISTKNICHQALFVKKSLFDKIGLFNTKYKMGADYEFNLRWMGSNCKAYYLNQIIAVYNEKGLSGQVWDKLLFDDFNDLLIHNNIVSERSFKELKKRNDSLGNSFRYKLGNKLLTPLSWLRSKIK